jgi:hypothetical protein
MKTIYQTVKMNNVFEVLEDPQNGLFLFKNGRYLTAPKSLDETKLYIDNYKREQSRFGIKTQNGVSRRV